MSARLLCLLALVACGTAAFPPEPKATDRNAKRTRAAYQITTRGQWQSLGYSRPSEDAALDFPVFIAVAEDRTACLLTNAQWASWREQAVVACQGSWRLLRP